MCSTDSADTVASCAGAGAGVAPSSSSVGAPSSGIPSRTGEGSLSSPFACASISGSGGRQHAVERVLVDPASRAHARTSRSAARLRGPVRGPPRTCACRVAEAPEAPHPRTRRHGRDHLVAPGKDAVLAPTRCVAIPLDVAPWMSRIQEKYRRRPLVGRAHAEMGSKVARRPACARRSHDNDGGVHVPRAGRSDVYLELTGCS
jgi:hypothetical protein